MRWVTINVLKAHRAMDDCFYKSMFSKSSISALLMLQHVRITRDVDQVAHFLDAMFLDIKI